jgi:type IV pilus assembly protein PilB
VPTPEELVAARFPFDPKEEIPKIFRPVGCGSCGKTGYKGRMAIHEVMTVTEDIERMLTEQHSSSEDIARYAHGEGMLSLRTDGMEKVRMGLTSIEEILRVVV